MRWSILIAIFAHLHLCSNQPASASDAITVTNSQPAHSKLKPIDTGSTNLTHSSQQLVTNDWKAQPLSTEEQRLLIPRNGKPSTQSISLAEQLAPTERNIVHSKNNVGDLRLQLMKSPTITDKAPDLPSLQPAPQTYDHPTGGFYPSVVRKHTQSGRAGSFVTVPDYSRFGISSHR